MITCPIEKYHLDISRNPVLTRVPLAEPLSSKSEQVTLDILIGSDYYYDIVKTERISLQDGLLLLGSELGYVVAGRVDMKSSSATQMLLSKSTASVCNFELERFWKLEEIGIKDSPDSTDDDLALKMFNESVTFDRSEQRYQVKWPWKPDKPQLPSNFGVAVGRLKSLVARMNSSEAMMKKYNETIQSQIASGVIEEVPEEPDGDVIHYLPHHAVVKPDKTTTKLRIVYDASCKATKESPSLNDSMFRGPVLLEDLCGILLRFRMKPVAIVSDIEKAFLQVGLQKPDRDAVRFLWLQDAAKPCSGNNILHYRFRRVPFGVIASPFLLAATINHHLLPNDTPVAANILANIYGDNVIGNEENTEKALAYYEAAKQLFKEASMNLREWFTNDDKFKMRIPEVDRGKEVTPKVLGMIWNTDDDSMLVQAGKPPRDNLPKITKRVILQTIAQVYDPCGLFAPITVNGKLLMQELWKKKYEWDERMPDHVVKRFRQISEEFQEISQHAIPRSLALPIESDKPSYELHGFCDASAKAYSAAIYLRSIVQKHCQTALVFCKSRVSPLKPITIPRLELLAMTIGSKGLTFVDKALGIQFTRKVLWPDSQSVLHWVLGKPVSTTFVKNRVNTIKRSTGVEYRYVPTSQNPADLLSRGLKANQLRSNQLWWEGPAWLVEEEVSWPQMPIEQVMTKEEVFNEQPSTPPSDADDSTYTLAASSTILSLFPIERWSNWKKATRIVTKVLKFLSNLRKTKHATNSTIEQQDKAELLLIMEAQYRHFGSLLDSKNKAARELTSRLGLFKAEDGLIRCSGTVEHSDLSESSKHPILLPKRDRLTELVIQWKHERLHHAGLKHTLAELRYTYWITRGRSEVKRVLRSCILCKRIRGGSFLVPKTPSLPQFRSTRSPPFSCVGIDYLGPLLIYPHDAPQQKVWIVLFTCSVTRAVHLELVESMTSEDFLLAMRPFIASWGYPKLIVSDNAKQFHSAHKTLCKLWIDIIGSKRSREFLEKHNIEWKFIIEKAPWMGGFYERTIGIVKGSLKAAINRRRLNIV